MVGPDAFTEVKYLEAAGQARALAEVVAVADRFRESFGRASGGLVNGYRMDGATTVVVAMGSVLGAVQDVVDDLRDDGLPVGALGITCFRPWPDEQVRAALAGARTVVVVEKSLAVGSGAILGHDIRISTVGTVDRVIEVIAGLGGRPVTRSAIRELIDDVTADRIRSDAPHFLGLDSAVVTRELAALDAGSPISTEAG